MLVAMMVLGLASAQDSGERAVEYEAITSVDFEKSLELEGELLKPALTPVFETRSGGFNPLITLRTNFLDRALEEAHQQK